MCVQIPQTGLFTDRNFSLAEALVWDGPSVLPLPISLSLLQYVLGCTTWVVCGRVLQTSEKNCWTETIQIHCEAKSECHWTFYVGDSKCLKHAIVSLLCIFFLDHCISVVYSKFISTLKRDTADKLQAFSLFRENQSQDKVTIRLSAC